MKAEINLENKAKLFSNYWGKTYSYRNEFGRFEDCVGYHFIEYLPYSILILKSLTYISDEDALNVEFQNSSHFNKCMVSYGEEFYDLILKHSQIDYLRSKGYALPFMGLSIDEMVNVGWIKVK